MLTQRRADRAPAAVEKPTITRGIAVLPLIGNADGLGRSVSTAIAAELADAPGLRVVPATSAPQRPHTLSDLRDASGLLNVGAFLYGELDTAGTTMRLALRLVVVANDSTLWAATFERPTAQTPDVVRDASGAVAAALREASGLSGTASSAPDTARALRSASERAAYSRQLAAQGRTDEAVREARRAHELDPLARDIHLNYILMLTKAGFDVEARDEAGQLRRITRYLGGQR